MDDMIFNMHTDVHACSCTWRCMGTIREFALKVNFGRKIPCHTRESNLPQWRASLTLYQLSYIPTYRHRMMIVASSLSGLDVIQVQCS